MGFDNTLTIIGNVTRDPELRYTQGGMAVATFGIAWNQKGRDGQEDRVSFFDVTCWRQLGENVNDSIRKGSRVVVHGRLDQRSWENKEGEKRSKVEILAEDVAPSLKWATAEVSRNDYNDNNSSSSARSSNRDNGGQAPAPAEAPTQYKMDEEPFRVDPFDWMPEVWGDYPERLL